MDTHIESINRELMVTDVTELEEGNEYYIEFNNPYCFSRWSGIYKLNTIFENESLSVKTVFKLIETSKDVIVYVYYKYNAGVTYFNFNSSVSSCNIYKLPTNDYILK